MVELRRCAKFGRNPSNRGRDMALFGFFKMAAVAFLDVEIFLNFDGRNAEDGRTASLCQIWSKSFELRPRYGDFAIFEDAGRRYFGFLNLCNFNAQDVRSTCVAVPNLVEIGRTAAEI